MYILESRYLFHCLLWLHAHPALRSPVPSNITTLFRTMCCIDVAFAVIFPLIFQLFAIFRVTSFLSLERGQSNNVGKITIIYRLTRRKNKFLLSGVMFVYYVIWRVYSFDIRSSAMWPLCPSPVSRYTSRLKLRNSKKSSLFRPIWQSAPSSQPVRRWSLLFRLLLRVWCLQYGAELFRITFKHRYRYTTVN